MLYPLQHCSFQYNKLLEKRNKVESDKGKIQSIIEELDLKKKIAIEEAWHKVDEVHFFGFLSDFDADLIRFFVFWVASVLLCFCLFPCSIHCFLPCGSDLVNRYK